MSGLKGLLNLDRRLAGESLEMDKVWKTTENMYIQMLKVKANIYRKGRTGTQIY